MSPRLSWLPLLVMLLMSCSDSGGVTDPAPGTGPGPAISVALGSSTLPVARGQSATVSITITRTGGFGAAVNLSLTDAPEGLSGTFAPASIPAGETGSTLTVTADLSASLETHELTVRATGQGVEEKTGSLAVTVEAAPSIALSLDPDALDLEQGTSGMVEIAVTRTNFSGPIQLSLEEAPDGVNWTFDPESLPADADRSTLTFEVAEDAPAGESELVLRASGEDVADQTVALVLMIAEVGTASSIALSVDPDALGIDQGTSGTVEIAVTRTNFSGPIQLSLEEAPDGVNATFDPESVPADADRSTLTFEVAEDAPAGESELVLRASGEGVEDRTFPLVLTITEVSSSVSWDRVVAGQYHSCGITDDGDAYCWGRNDDGQLGTGDQEPALRPALVQGGHTWADVGLGIYHTCGLTTDGVAYCWGRGLHGSLGTGTTESSATPVPVSGGRTFRLIGVADHHTCALTSAGDVYCWGNGHFGATGNPTHGNDLTPRLVSGGHTFQTLAAGGSTNCSITTEGAAYCWGLSLTQDRGSAVPDEVPGEHVFAGVTVGFRHACAWTEARDGYCWGHAPYRQLGNDATGTVTTATPVAVVGGHAFAGISAGWKHTCGVTTIDQAYCWGFGAGGMLGIGPGFPSVSATAVPVVGGIAFVQVSAGWDYTCGVTTDGDAYCWGTSTRGALGHPPEVRSLVPLRVMDPE